LFHRNSETAERFRILSGAVRGTVLTHFPGQVWCTLVIGLIFGYFLFLNAPWNWNLFYFGSIKILTELDQNLFQFRQVSIFLKSWKSVASVN